jgi:glyoxylase-like metal-dependent hydrolase (beta-lactamase superfamily II)
MLRASIMTLAAAATLNSPCAPAQSFGREARATDLHWWSVRNNVWMLVGAGANLTASIGPDGVLLVNSGSAAASQQIVEAIDELQSALASAGRLDRLPPERGGAETRSRMPINTHAPPKPVRYILNTSMLAHNVGGNASIAATGVTYTGGNVAGTISDSSQGAAILAHENVLVHLVAQGADFDAIPTEVYILPEYKLSTFFNDEGIRLIHIANATTDGDSIVYFRGSDVIATGDLFDMTSFPIIDVGRGGSINGVLEGLNEVLRLAIPEFRTEGGTMIVPGNGRLADSADVGYYRDMLTIIRDQVQALLDQGYSLEQMLNMEQRPTFGYEGRFGSDEGGWTTAMFLTSVYQSLSEN